MDNISSWRDFPVLAEMQFEDKLEQYIELKSTIDHCQTQLDALKSDIEAALTVASPPNKKVMWNDHPVSIRGGRSEAKVSAQLLASRGVDLGLIKECTVPGTPYTYVFVDKTADEKAKDKAVKDAAKLAAENAEAQRVK